MLVRQDEALLGGMVLLPLICAPPNGFRSLSSNANLLVQDSTGHRDARTDGEIGSPGGMTCKNNSDRRLLWWGSSNTQVRTLVQQKECKRQSNGIPFLGSPLGFIDGGESFGWYFGWHDPI